MFDMGFKRIVILLLFMLVISPAFSYEIKKDLVDVFVANDDLAVINDLIADSDASWIAGETSISKSVVKPRLLDKRPVVDSSVSMLRSVSRSLPPSSVNWSNVNGSDWISPVKDQGSCGSCWAFSAIGVVESRVNIAINDSGYDVDLSEQEIVSCYGDGLGCEGGLEVNALNYMQSSGVVNEACFPYAGVNATNYCLNKCLTADLVKVVDYSLLPASVNDIKQAINDYGPVTVYLAVYSDFYFYTSGVYSHVWGGMEGFHAVSIVGYNDAGSYWICKNSWGTGWGEDGFFRVSYDENVLDFSEWYYYYYYDLGYHGSFFLDESYVVTSTDIDTDGVSDEVDNCPLVSNSLQADFDFDSLGDYCDDSDGDLLMDYNDDCPDVPGVAYYDGCPDVYSPDINFSASFYITGIANLSWQASDYCNLDGKVYLNYSIVSPVLIADSLNASGFYLWDTAGINTENANISIFAYDDYGNSNEHTYVGVTIDNTAPDAFVVSPSNNFLSNGSPFDFNISVSDNLNSFFNCHLYDNNNYFFGLSTSERASSISYSYLYEPYEEGVHELMVNCSDSVNLSSKDSINVTIDLFPPQITVNSPLSDMYNHYPGLINISVFDYTLNDTWLFVDSINLTDFSTINRTSVMLSRKGDYFTNSSYVLPNSTLVNLSFFANDSFSRVSEPFDHLLFIDNKIPEVNLISPTNDFNLTDSNVNFSFEIIEDYPFLYCNISIDNQLTINDLVDSIEADIRSSSLVVYNNSFTDGNYYWYVNCSDYFNKTTSVINSFKLDTKAPDILINQPYSGVYGSSVMDINVSVIDELSDIDSVVGFVDGALVSLSNNGVYWFFDDYSFDNDTSITLVINANDSNGFNSTSSSTFFIDTIMPFIDLISPANNSFINVNYSYFNYFVSDNHASLINCSIVIDDFLNAYGADINGTNNDFPMGGFYDGSYDWYINCSDGFNEARSNVSKLTVDTVAPLLSVFSPVNETYDDGSVLVNNSVVDSNLLGEPVILIDGVSIGYNEVFYHSFSDGIHYLNLSGVDKAGNFNSSKIFFSVDSTPPVVSVSNSMNATFDSSSVLLSFSYSDYSPVTCSYSLDDNPLVSITCVNQTIGPFSDNSVHSIKVVVNDSLDHSTTSDTVIFSVNYNQAPVITGSYPDITIEEGSLLYFDFNATDPDGDDIVFSDNTNLFDINTVSGIVSYNIGYNKAGSYSITVTASDGSLVDTKSFIISITNVPICGDSNCDSGESCYTCALDCSCPPASSGGGSYYFDNTTTNQTIANQTILNNTVANLTVANLTVANQTILNNTIANNITIRMVNFSDTVINSTINSLLSVNNTANFSVIEVSEFSYEKPKDPLVFVNANNINDSFVNVSSFRTILGIEGGGNVSLITKNITNTNNESIINFTIIEVIPKSYALSVSDLVFHSIGNLIVIEDDPVVAWVFSELKPKESVSVSYEVKKDVSVIDEVPMHSLVTANRENLVASEFVNVVGSFSLLPSDNIYVSIAIGLVFLFVMLFSFGDIKRY